MGSGAKFRDDAIPLPTVTLIYAQLDLVREAIEKATYYSRRVLMGSLDPEDWEQLKVWRERLKSRVGNLDVSLKRLASSQDKP